MTDQIERFYGSIQDVARMSAKDLVAHFVYFLTVEMAHPSATAGSVTGCFQQLRLNPPLRVAAILSEGVAARPARYVKLQPGGYTLERHYKDQLAAGLGARTAIVQTSTELRELEQHLAPGAARDFLSETIDCFEAGANRAAIVMCWVLALDHMFHHILKHKLAAFNAALASHPNKQLRKAPIVDRDDFSDIPEKAFLELCRTAGVVSNDVRKILQSALDTRNSAAHQSGVTVNLSKVLALVEDLVANVVLKYKL